MEQRQQNWWTVNYYDTVLYGTQVWIPNKYERGTDRFYKYGDKDYDARFEYNNRAFMAPASGNVMKVFKFRVAFQLDWRWTENADHVMLRAVTFQNIEGVQHVTTLSTVSTFLGVKKAGSTSWDDFEDSWYDSYPPVEMVMTGLFTSDRTFDTFFRIDARGERGAGEHGKFEQKVISFRHNMITQLSDANYP